MIHKTIKRVADYIEYILPELASLDASICGGGITVMEEGKLEVHQRYIGEPPRVPYENLVRLVDGDVRPVVIGALRWQAYFCSDAGVNAAVIAFAVYQTGNATAEEAMAAVRMFCLDQYAEQYFDDLETMAIYTERRGRDI